MQIRLDGRVALVTGASSGIGYQAALALGEAGADVCVQGKSHMDKAEDLVNSIIKMGSRAIAVKADVSDSEDVDRMVKTATTELGGIDIAYLNAGIFELAPLEQTSDELWQRHLDVNLNGAFYGTRSVVPEMRKRGKGKIIYSGSIFGPYGVPGAIGYCVSKMAIHGLARSLAIELAPLKINVNAVAPGDIVTPMNDGLYLYIAEQAGKPGDIEAGKQELVKSYPWGRLGDVKDIAPTVVFLASDAADFVTGQVIFVDGGYSVA
jgi:NAD(P)-dependent dehydrogenase (short-subunit alcohol dehydrogenase family)